MNLLILVFVLALLTALVFWQRHIFLYWVACGPTIAFGFYYAFQTDPFLQVADSHTVTFMAGVTIVILGLFEFYRGLMKLLGR